MSDATVTTDTAHPSIVAREAAHFGTMAKDWWDPCGSSAMLHRLNPVRLRYIREQTDRHWGVDPASFTPLAGKRALDVGCGAGLLAEPLKRLGASVTAIDAAAENIAVARDHAAAGGLVIDYRAGGIEAVAGETFDLVTCLEVIEHVANPVAFVTGLAGALADGGLLILSTPNRTPVSRLAMITLAEGTGRIPRGTHDWNRFITPDELATMLTNAGLTVRDTRGITFSPTTGFALSSSLALNHLVTATRA
ncbi:bifunctional 2-polyprenyl-6-hydroxyphenol methylase/3-demethylubiquinol 3-O-methyltransferase UbiG [Sphingomonas radiodurans]|uniref:bifunctional 2-polyprenyl-6-hydroxyphenol methylase/3-demethylubiquinol 3-O-methyltransferase UbiG n=1 Tax=Sphingomonas radiodurans TaxID=2890321 RepID=UPI001E6237FF|nr:bifunctional 2-polyprenyl-6-hydroxyphenol methylase/3-demethylubiquinol 3-O-methyltransferase UbiG [Sphingomonas radiodurans]WBH15782.1 bifunctional 2-polyprenyl-6-hydroxyphenol methylase/3-demethylubiquinol 3-O-methyltransferase UbiG [Sphingomonas radiodurans]